MDEITANDGASQKLRDTKLYTLARHEPLMAFLIPSIDIQIAVEQQLSEDYPRSSDDADDTRIFLLFTNRKNNTIVSKLMDHERLDSGFDLSRFTAGFMATQGTNDLPGSEIDQINAALATTLNVALATVLGVDNDRSLVKKQQELSKNVIRSITSALFDDPLDVVVVIKEQVIPQHGGEPERSVCLLTGMWKLKTRPTSKAGENTTDENLLLS